MIFAIPPPLVLKRGVAEGYSETSQRAVSNKPAWMNASDESNPTKSVTIADFIDDDKASDDGENFEKL